MKPKINYKILYLILSLYYLWLTIRRIDYYINCPIEIDNTALFLSETIIHLVLFLVFGVLFLRYSNDETQFPIFSITSIKITLFFIWFNLQIKYGFFIDYFEEFPIRTILMNIIYLTPLFVKEKQTKISEQLPNNSECSLNYIRATYESLFITMLIAIIIIDCFEFISYMLYLKLSTKIAYNSSNHVFIKTSIVILSSLVMLFIHEKFKRYIIILLQSYAQIVFGYTIIMFATFYLLEYTIDIIVYGGNYYKLEQCIILISALLLFIFLYFRKGRQLIKKDLSVSHLAFYSFIYCISGSLILAGLTDMYQRKNGIYSNSEYYASSIIVLGVLILLLNQNLSKFLSPKN